MPIMGGGGGGAAFNGGTITQPLVVDTGALATAGGVSIQGSSGANVDRFLVNYLHTLLELTGDGVFALSSDDTLGVQFIGTGTPCTVDIYDTKASYTDNLIDSQDGITITKNGGAGKANLSLVSGTPVFKAGTDTSGGILTDPPVPATTALSSGTAAQILTTRDVHTVTPVTFNPTAGAAATCVVAVGKNSGATSALWTETEPPGVVFDGTIHGIHVYVPAAWYLKLTVVNATIGTTTYY